MNHKFPDVSSPAKNVMKFNSYLYTTAGLPVKEKVLLLLSYEAYSILFLDFSSLLAPLEYLRIGWIGSMGSFQLQLWASRIRNRINLSVIASDTCQVEKILYFFAKDPFSNPNVGNHVGNLLISSYLFRSFLPPKWHRQARSEGI